MKKYMILLFLLTGILAGVIHANTPPDKSVMMIFQYMHRWGGNPTSSNFYKSLNELVETGINVAYIPMYNSKDADYTVAAKVKECHDFGIYVAGGAWNRDGNGAAQQYIEMSAGTGCDYGVITDMYDGSCAGWKEDFTQTDYQNMKTVANTAKMVETFPVIFCDAWCNSNFSSWNTDGLYQQILSVGWDNTTIPLLTTYQSNNAGKFAGAWVYAKTDNFSVDPVAYLDDSYFKSWFTTVWNQTGNVGIYMWERDGAGNAEFGWGTNWPSKGPHVKSTTGKGDVIAVWEKLEATRATDAVVRVKQTSVGLDPAKVECYYAVEPNRYTRHTNVSATGTKGTKDWVTITAKGLPSGTVLFKIKDIYSGNYFRGPRTWKLKTTFGNTATKWSAIQGTQMVSSLATSSLTASFKFTIQDTASGLDVETLVCEFSTDGGETWTAHEAKITGSAGTVGKEIVTVKEIPFKEDKPGVNKLRLNIKTTSGDDLSSEDFDVKVQLPPVLAGLNMTGENNSSYDFTVSAEDDKGVVLGSQDVPARADAIVLYHFNGDAKDASGNGQHGTLYGNAKIEEVDSWKSSGGKESVLSLDGVNSFVNFDHGYLGRSSEFTISAWLYAQNGNTPIILGGHEAFGSLEFMVGADFMKIQVFSNPRAAFPALISEAGTFSRNEWHHVTVTNDGMNGRLYIDGKLVAEESWSGYKIYSFKPLMMGRPGNRSRYYKGYIDEVQILGKAMTESEIVADYFSGSYRGSSDGGETWGPWRKSEISGTGASAASTLFSLKGVNFPTKTDSVNRVQIAARDEYGHAVLKEYALTADNFVAVETIVQHVTCLTLYPNPFKTRVNMTFNLEFAQAVELDIYSIDGHIVRNIGDRKLTAGKNTLFWEGLDNKGNQLPAGQYFARMKVGNQVMVKKLMKL
ncbi:MAG: T9SS type A sorting domain-containing protein [Fibrobacteria bacterium]|nr:T9SS type A sorting domain-containing protein [Fibrobacteria bacterium]